MAKIEFVGQINKTLHIIAGIFALGVCFILGKKKKKPLKKYFKRFNRIEKTAYNTLNTVSNRIEVQKVKDGALDYQKCLEIYNKQREINNESV